MTASSKSGRRLEAALAGEERQRVRVILQQGLDEALRAYVVNLFGVWMRDPAGQPERASAGVSKALEAYHQAVELIDDATSDAAA